MRPYSPGGRLNTYATALLQINSEATPQSASFTAGTTGVSNPVRSPSFRSSPSDTFWSGAFATGSPPRLKGFYPYPGRTPDLPRSQAKQYLLRAVWLSHTISQKTYLTGYERSRPSIRGYHLRRWCYRGGCHQSCPHPYSPSYLHLAKDASLADATRSPPITVSSIVEISRLLHPVGLGPLSQCPSGGHHSHGP